MAAIDRLFQMMDKMQAEVTTIGKSVAVLMDHRDDARTKRRLTYEKIEEIVHRTSDVEGGLRENTRVCTDMRNDIDAMQKNLADYRHNRARVAPALQRIEVIEQHVTNCQLRAAREEGWSIGLP